MRTSLSSVRSPFKQRSTPVEKGIRVETINKECINDNE